jgi:putative hemolysin
MQQPVSTPEFSLRLPPAIEQAVQWIVGLGRAKRLYAMIASNPRNTDSPHAFCKACLEALGVTYEIPSEHLWFLRQITGPILLIANHPFGVIDTLFAMTLLGEIRNDFKFITSSVVDSIAPLRTALIPVHVMGEQTKQRAKNTQSMRQCVRFLQAGGAAGMFPSGKVASFEKWNAREAS